MCPSPSLPTSSTIETFPALFLSSSQNLQNWALEFKQWSPDFKVVSLAGGRDELAEIIANQLISQNFEVLHNDLQDVSH